MAINNTDTKVKVSGDGAERTFSFPFKIFQNTDIVVQIIDKDTDVVTTLVLGTDYTVSINTVTEGGTITIPEEKTPSADEWVFIYSSLPFTQTVVLPTDGAFREISVSNGLDRLCRLIQQVWEKTSRAIVQRADVTSTELVLPSPDSNKLIGWNEDGDGLENKTPLDADVQAACEAARAGAESAKDDAETAQGLAESAKGDAETAQGLAESARDEAVTAAEKIPTPEAGDEGKTIVVNGDGDGYEIVPIPAPEIAIFNDTKDSNTPGGTFASGAWRTRDLNTELYNTISGGELLYLLPYDNLSAGFTLGETVTGGSSEATGTIVLDSGSVLTVKSITGTFQDEEQITDGEGGTADVDNAIPEDTATGCDYANQCLLPAGTYTIEASAPVYEVVWHQLKFRNITDDEDSIIGTSALTFGSGGQERSYIVGAVVISDGKVFEIQHRCSSTRGSNGFGTLCNFGVGEVYTQIKITKLA